MIRSIMIEDYEDINQLWQNTDGIGLSDADSEKNIMRFLKRNEGLSYLYEENGTILGTVLCGHDGRRGYIYHLAVHKDRRNSGIGKKLLSTSMVALKEVGIQKCHIFVFRVNKNGSEFWLHHG
ncbi:MAG: GNAT family N-acetyltransferase [Firmicutes bacterium]|nr:GNAT family N-acetyltransferase [Bacillota bacterium]